MHLAAMFMKSGQLDTCPVYVVDDNLSTRGGRSDLCVATAMRPLDVRRGQLIFMPRRYDAAGAIMGSCVSDNTGPKVEILRTCCFCDPNGLEYIPSSKNGMCFPGGYIERLNWQAGLVCRGPRRMDALVRQGLLAGI